MTANRALMDGPEGVAKFAKSMVRWISDDRNLELAFEHLSTKGGGSPGPDGLTFDEFESRSALMDTSAACVKKSAAKCTNRDRPS